MTAFVPGLRLSREMYADLVRPLLGSRFPGLPHGAALLGRGSEVLGFDDEMSTDHDWQARVLVFVEDDEAVPKVDEVLRTGLPSTFRDHAVGHEVHTVRGYVLEQLAVDLGVDLQGEITASDWLTFPEQGLRTFTAGEVFHDEVGLGAARERLAHYPRDVWLYLMVAGWWRISPEANLVGRAGSVGDELGSALIGSRLVGDLMRLCFLMEREYAPYSKWFGTAFSRLACGPEMTPVLWRVVRAETWSEREQALVAAYERLTVLHNALGITEPVTPVEERMWDRPFRVAWADVPGLLRAEIRDPEVAGIADRWPVGPVDQFRELLWPPRNRRLLLRVFEQSDGSGGSEQ